MEGIMSKVSKTLQSIVLGGLIFIAAPQKAEAFGLIPPMPWDVEVDIPGDAGKVVSLLKSTYRKVQMIQSQMNTINLDAIKSGKAASLFKDIKGDYKKFAKGPKVPGKGKIKASQEYLGLEEGDLDEKHYYDAFTRLFLAYPSTKDLKINGKKPSYQVVHTAYKHKGIEFNQDMIVDAYLAGRVTEDYLVLVERTLKRLDLCQKKAEGYEPGSEKCVFFGLPFVKVEAEDTSKAPDENSDGNGQLGEAMNNYVVTIVYDRLMRIIEDLTATEAIYRSARQLDLITPSMPQSSAAEKYIPQKYHFAYSQTHETVHADKIISTFKPSSCEGESENCPAINKDTAELEGIAKTELLGKLQPIEDSLNKAVILHNLKVQLPEYKDQFRRYRKAVEIHERALNALKTSDRCAQDFIKEYGGNPSIWGAGAEVNDYGTRTGVSKDLILKYQQATKTTIIGTNEKCTGYYETCPEGYTLDTSKPCEVLDEEGKVAETFPLYACTLDIGSSDTEKENSDGSGPNYPEKSLAELANPDEPRVDNSTYNDANLLGDSTKADVIDNDNRIKAENTWQIGRQKLLDLTEAGVLKFDPWNDQTELQTEYLRQKYRNIELIIRSMDQGVESFKLASTKASKDEPREDEALKAALEAVAKSENWETAVAKAKSDCKAELGGLDECNVNSNDGSIKCKYTLIEYDEEGNEISREPKYCTKTQLVGGTTSYAKGGNVTLGKGQTSCSVVSLNVVDITKHFFSDELGKCKEKVDKQAEAMKESAKEQGRMVAQDVLVETVNKRAEQDEKIQDFVKAYDKKHQEKKEKLASKKASLGTYNKEINKNTDKKNSAQQEWKNTLDRVAEIDKEIKQIDARKPYAKVKKPTEDNKVIQVEDTKAICAMEIQKLKLAFEKEAISGKSQAEAGANWQIPAECDEEVQKDLTDSLGEDFFKTPQLADYVISMNQRLKDNSVEMKDLTDEEKALINESNKKHVVPTDAQKTIAEAKEIIEANAAKRDAINKEITDLIVEIEKDAEAFAKEYLKEAGEAQRAVEEANIGFEAFLVEVEDTSPHRMATCNPREDDTCESGEPWYGTDNLKATMEAFLGYENFESSIRAKIESQFSNFNISGLSGNHVINSAVASACGLQSAGLVSAQEIVNAVKKKVIDAAVARIIRTINNSDDAISNAVTAALDLVKDMEKFLFGKDDNGNPNVDNPDEKQMAFMSDHDNYGLDEPITKAHDTLVKGLIAIQNGLAGQGATGNVFGIPDANMVEDTEYYVTLPARGVNYEGMNACERDFHGKAKPKTDCGAGRDYNAPKRPLLNLPPLREVFFYSALDYKDTPKENGEDPAITHLLNLKYPKDQLHKWEYLPETWLYLLARPNMRDDGKYQQTFEERAYGDDHLGNLINKNGATNEGFNMLIARAGVYPCKLKDGGIIDVVSGNDADSIRFVYRRNAPAGLTLQECQEVALNNVQGTSCYTYNKERGGICHLLADHGKDGVEDTQYPSLGGDSSLYEKYSELGQMLAWRAGGIVGGVFSLPPDFVSARLFYRPLQRNLHEFLLNQESESNQKNSMERQNIQAATFTRNIFSSFLDTVNAEHAAKRGLDTAKENLKDTVNSLCSQIESARPKSSQEVEACNTHCQGKTGSEAAKCEESCQQEKVNDCVKDMLEGDGLAKTAEDETYGIKGEYGKEEYEGIDCEGSNSNDAYASYFCQLADWQDELIDKAENGYTDDYKKDANGKPLKVAGFSEVKNDKDAYKVQERIKNIQNIKDVLAADKFGVVFITPGMTKGEMSNAISNAQADRLATRVAEDEGIKSMDNQSQIVPYCPIYINRKERENQH